jgi:hypothetical protein
VKIRNPYYSQADGCRELFEKPFTLIPAGTAVYCFTLLKARGGAFKTVRAAAKPS